MISNDGTTTIVNGPNWSTIIVDLLYHVVVPTIVIVDQHGIIMVITIMPNYNWNDYQSVILNQILDHYQLNMI
jgi:glucuronate isomerase